MIDIHSHILPNIDDGAKNVAESVKMLQMLKSQGVTDVVVTPHFKPSTGISIEKFLELRRQSYALLRDAIEGRTDVPDIHLGAEVTICVEMAEMEGLDRLCIDGTRYILIELDCATFGDWVYNTLFSLSVKHSVTPIIAHIDRYFGIIKDEKIKRLTDLRYPIQFNAESFLYYRSRKKLIKLISHCPEQFCFVGTDCHSSTDRKPNMDEFEKKANKFLGLGFLAYLEDMSRDMINGKIIN